MYICTMEATTTDDKYHRETGMTIAESVESFMEEFKLEGK